MVVEALVAKKFVVVAFVVVLFVASRFGKVLEAVVEVAVKYGASIAPPEETLATEREPAVRVPPTVRLPVMSALPLAVSAASVVVADAESVVADIDAPVMVPPVHSDLVTFISSKLSPRAMAPSVLYTFVMLVEFAEVSVYILFERLLLSSARRAFRISSVIPTEETRRSRSMTRSMTG